MIRCLIHCILITSFCLSLSTFANAQSESNSFHYQLIEKDGHQIHLLEVDPDEYQFISVRAQNESEREEVSALVKQHGAVAGINGGFFHLTKEGVALPAGALKIDNQWLGYASLPRGAIGWNAKNGYVLVDRIVTKKTEKDAKTIVEVLPQFETSNTAKKTWQEFPYIVGGIPVLLKNGKTITNHSIEKTINSFLDERHARTAVCVKENHHWIFLVSAHTKEAYRQYTDKAVEGLTIPELTQFLQELGCVNAINLDGGGSSTLVIDGKVMNTPAGDMDEIFHLFHERAVSDAILVMPKT